MKLIAWDFDGVLNRGFQGGFQLWQQEFEADLGTSAKDFTDYMFATGRFDAVLTGQRDLVNLISAWITAENIPHTPARILDYWLSKDAHPDPQVMDWLARSPCPGVIATNNEAHRANYIWHNMGFATRVERIFASGPMGVRKPDGRFFAQIEDWSDLSPADILLIDDADKNIDAAAARGWQVFHFTDDTRHNLPAILGITP